MNINKKFNYEKIVEWGYQCNITPRSNQRFLNVFEYGILRRGKFMHDELGKPLVTDFTKPWVER